MSSSAEHICQKMRALIESGRERDLSCLVKQALNSVSAEELLAYRYPDSVCVKRPSTGRDLRVLNPNALMLAVAGWFEDIVLTLAKTRACLDATFSVRDESSVVREYDGVTALMLAAITGREPFIKVLISCGASVNQQNSLGDTPVYQACLEGHASVADLLIQNGGYLNLANSSGITPLMIACFVNNADIVERLLRYGARFDACDLAGKNAAFYCVPAGAVDCFRLLRQVGIRVEAEPQGTSLLMEAAYQGSSDEMLDLLLAIPGAAQARDPSGRSALFYAVEGGSPTAFQRLLRAGTPVEAAAPSGTTLLMTAAMRYRRQMAELLLDLGEEAAGGLRCRDAAGRSALFYCAANPEPDLLQLLLACDLPMERAADGSTLLMACIARQNWSLVQFLLQRVEALAALTDLGAVDNDGNSALSLAVEAQNLQLLHQLIGLGARPADDAESGGLLLRACACGNADAALHFAGEAAPAELAAFRDAIGGSGILFHCVRGGHLDLTRHFLRLLGPTAGVDEAAGGDGRNIFHEACAVGRIGMVQMLMQELPEEQVRQKDAQGRNAFFYAVQSGNPRLLELLDGTPGLEPEDDHQGVTLLMHALACGGPAVCSHLLEDLAHYRVTELATDAAGRSILFYAAESDSWQLLRETLERHRQQLSLADVDSEGRTVLMHSIERGAGATAQQLAAGGGQELGLDPSRADAKGENALFYAVRARNPELVAALLRHGVQPAPSARGHSILALAYATGQGRLADFLLTAAPPTPDLLNGSDEQGCTAFHHLVIEQRLDHLARLAALYDPLRDSDERGEGVLIKAARQANPGMTKLLLESFPCDPARVDADGMNALSHAVLAGSFKTCKLLLTYGVRPLPEAKDGSTLLHLAARSGNVQVFMHLLRFFVLDRDAVNAQDANGTSVAHLLCELGLWDCVEAFHRRGGRLGEVYDKKGRSPLMLAALSNNLVLVKLLLHLLSQANLSDRDSNGRTCLHYACQAPCPNPLVLRQLLDRRMDILARDSDGFCALHYAVQGASGKAVQLLLDRGADPFKQTKAGTNAFELCKQNGHGSLQLLEQQFRLDQSQSGVIEGYAKRLLEVDLAELVKQMAKKDVVACEHNAKVMELMNQQSERRDYLLGLLTRRGRTKIQDFLTELKPFSGQIAMELRAKLFVKPESEFMV